MYVPGAHLTQTDEPADETAPAGHMEQAIRSVALGFREALPRGQGRCVLASGHTFPGPQMTTLHSWDSGRRDQTSAS